MEDAEHGQWVYWRYGLHPKRWWMIGAIEAGYLRWMEDKK